ncbi:MAG: hypothetical protein AVDCRST_MAG89-790, partial [uncultured Gemmatimonadetes bacterium]
GPDNLAHRGTRRGRPGVAGDGRRGPDRRHHHRHRGRLRGRMALSPARRHHPVQRPRGHHLHGLHRRRRPALPAAPGDEGAAEAL